VILPRFDEIPVLQAIERVSLDQGVVHLLMAQYRITWALVVPPVVIILTRSPNLQKYDLSSLRGMISAAAPLGVDLCVALQKQLPNVIMTQGYGSSFPYPRRII
jgi:acyl-CoA synthetase (AMP-forming)/AMP-acid ligase II